MPERKRSLPSLNRRKSDTRVIARCAYCAWVMRSDDPEASERRHMDAVHSHQERAARREGTGMSKSLAGAVRDVERLTTEVAALERQLAEAEAREQGLKATIEAALHDLFTASIHSNPDLYMKHWRAATEALAAATAPAQEGETGQ